jgi:hypothetical protein
MEFILYYYYNKKGLRMYTPCVGVAYSRAWIHGTENVYKMKRIYY